MKGVISIFCLPQELEDLALTLNGLKRNSVFLDGTTQFKVDVTMCLSDKLTDWESTKLPKEYFEERSEELCKKYLDWCDYKLLIETGDKILGCVSQRRMSLETNPDADFFIWVDTDMFFKDSTLYYLTSTHKLVKDSGLEMFVITPQFVKQWDDTWDSVVNRNYLNKPHDYYKTTNIIRDSLLSSEEINVLEMPIFKAAGGWFTLISKPLLQKTGVPESFGHYGLEDTFVMVCADIMKRVGIDVRQFVLENLIIGENHTSRVNDSVKSFISSIDKKDEFRNIAHANWNNEIHKFIKNNNISI